jgi:glycine reductase
VLAREIEREKIPVALITAMSSLGQQMGANRIVKGISIPHPCGDPSVPPETDKAIRQKILQSALEALQTDVGGPTVFTPALHTSS